MAVVQDGAATAARAGEPLCAAAVSSPPLPLPSLAEQAHAEALVKAFGSDEVLERMETWRTVVQEMIDTTRLIELEDKGDTIPQAGEPIARQVFLQLKPQERETREALVNQVAVELGHRTDANPDRSQQE